MIRNKFTKESLRKAAIVAVTFVSVFAIKAGIGSFASGQEPFNPSVSTISTSTVSQVQPYSEDAIYIEDEDLYKGETVIAVNGMDGVREEVMEITTDGDKVTVVNVLETNVIKEAVPAEIHVGIKERPDYIFPVESFSYSYGVGYREDGFHKGLDLLCPSNTKVMAAAAGTIVYSDWMDGYGYCVFIDHGNGVETRYAHMNECVVSVGETVEQGQQIGWSGCTGDSECPHVHMETYENGAVIDPIECGYLVME